MTGNIEQAAWILAEAIKELAHAILGLNYFSQKATFVAAPTNVPVGEPLQPSYPQPTYPYPPYVPPTTVPNTTTPMPMKPVIWNAVGPESGSTIL